MGRPNILYTAFVAQDYFSTPVKKMGVSVKGLSTITSLASAKISASLAKVSTAAMEIGMAGAALAAGIVLPLGLATKAAVDFQAQMSNVSTLVDTTVEDMGAMGDAVLRLSKRIPKPINDLTEGLYYVRSAGVAAADAMNVLEVSGRVAVAGLSTTTEAAKAVTSAMVTFKAQGLSAAQIANSFFLTVREGKTKMENINESFGATALVVASAGVKLEEFNGAVAALTNTGMEASLAQMGVKNTIIGLIKPTSEMKQVFDALNVSSGEQLIAMLGYGGALDAVAQKSKTLNIEQAKLFNRTAFTTFIGLAGQARDQRIKDTKEQMEAQDALSGAVGKQMATADAQLKIFNNTVSTLGISIGNLLIPPLSKMVSIISPIVDSITNFAKEHKFLSGVIVDSVAIIGVFAATVGVAGLAVGTVTKAFGILKGAVYVYNFSIGFASVKTKALTGDILTNEAAVKGASMAYKGLGASIGTVLTVATALYYTLKGLSFLEDKRQDKKKWVNQHLSKEVKDRYGVVRSVTGNEVEYNRGSGVQVEENAPADIAKQIRDTYGAYDSTMEAKSIRDDFLKARNDSLIDANQQKEYDQIRKGDSTYFAPQQESGASAKGSASAAYVPKSASQNVTITLENNSGMTAKVQKNTGSAAEPVPIKIVSTTSRKKPTTA